MKKGKGNDMLNAVMLEAAQEQLEQLGIRYEDGWTGAFSRQQVAGAIPNGTPIVKVMMEDGDINALGTRGTVLGSIKNPSDPRTCYFVEWDHIPRKAFAVIESKIAAVKQ